LIVVTLSSIGSGEPSIALTLAAIM